MKIGTRIAELRVARGWSQRDLAMRCGWDSQSRIGNYERDSREPSLGDIEIIAKAFGITSQELLFGSAAEPSATGKIISYESDDELSDHDYVMIDRYDLKLSAGCGAMTWVVHEKDPLAFRANFFKARRLDATKLKAAYIRGDSMTPFLNSGDTVLIDISDTDVVDGEVYAICYDDEWFVKRVFQVPGGLVLRSDNPKYPPIEVVGERLSMITILGHVVWRAG